MKHIGRNTLCAVALFAAAPIAAPTPADAFQRISMAEAEQRCFNRVRRFANESVGRSGRDRSAFEIRSAYKRCIFGFTGKNATSVPDFGQR
ncbi:MAG: hypothetical protein AAF218_04290 [Pseudomonadota bacterium]